MSSSNPHQFTSATNSHSEAERLLANLRSLRNDIVTAWRERAVILTREERTKLRDEIKQTCQFLDDLTRAD